MSKTHIEESLEAVIKKYNLPKDDVYTHKNGTWKIITANGIRRIIYKDEIQIHKYVHHISFQDKTAVISCTATLYDKDRGNREFEALGEVSPDNNTFSYFVSVAEKRAEGRAVLNVVGLYAVGWRSEEEVDSAIEGARIMEKRKEQTQSAIAETTEKIQSLGTKKTSRSLSNKKAFMASGPHESELAILDGTKDIDQEKR